MTNKTIMTAGAFILSMIVLIAATNPNVQEVTEQERERDTLYGIVVDADSEDGISNATVYIKKENGENGMHSDTNQQEDQATEHDQDELDSATTDHNGEFEFNNVNQLKTQATDAGSQSQQTQQRDQDESFVLVVEAEGYETKEQEIKLSDYLNQDDERGEMDRDQDMDRDHDEDKDKDKIKIELTRSN